MGLAPYGKDLFDLRGPIIDLSGNFNEIVTDYSHICLIIAMILSILIAKHGVKNKGQLLPIKFS